MTAPLVDAYPNVAAWLGRVLDFGHGASSEMSAADAIEVAREATPAALPAAAWLIPTVLRLVSRWRFLPLITV